MRLPTTANMKRKQVEEKKKMTNQERGYNVCGAIGKHGKPCQRIGVCLVHLTRTSLALGHTKATGEDNGPHNYNSHSQFLPVSNNVRIAEQSPEENHSRKVGAKNKRNNEVNQGNASDLLSDFSFNDFFSSISEAWDCGNEFNIPESKKRNIMIGQNPMMGSTLRNSFELIPQIMDSSLHFESFCQSQTFDLLPQDSFIGGVEGTWFT
eukprot:TRINITY_DN11528_c0_g1_i1.p1 TRINITY_DN11528_c0_g1~~TRINITY_DN11528_c0_g1_i1.p1  ORF type:complete len:208 (-),score=49.03 TRINITY_DN11528_c0_g1_i1:65-688(-)